MKGSYILIIKVEKDLNNVKIGKLGNLSFKKGFYCYVGSAFGKYITIEKRISRHLRKDKKLRWHIDYLLSNKYAKIVEIIKIPSDHKIEEEISKFVQSYADYTIKGFGSTDCRVKGNLHYFLGKDKLEKLIQALSKSYKIFR